MNCICIDSLSWQGAERTGRTFRWWLFTLSALNDSGLLRDSLF